MINLRHDWQAEEVAALFELPFMDLLFEAQTLHRQCFAPNAMQLSTLCNIKTGNCPEDCAYCPQSVRYQTGLEPEKLLPLAEVMRQAEIAKANGASRFCLGAAWRSPRKKDLEKVVAMVQGIKALGLESCATLGMIDDDQAHALKAGGLDFYNHNLDTSPEYYKKIITTRTYEDRIDTLRTVRKAGIKVCCGGILGMGETREDRVQFLLQLANVVKHPESVTINKLIRIAGTPLEDAAEIDPFEFVRTIAIARLMMPQSFVRLTAGRESMSDELQTLCFLAGANSIFLGEKLLTAKNPGLDQDQQLLSKLGISAC